jgi:hypothetical protein
MVRDTSEIEKVLSLLKDTKYIVVDARKIKKAYKQISINRLCPVIIFSIKDNVITLQAYPNGDSINIEAIERNSYFVDGEEINNVYICPFEFRRVLLSTRSFNLTIRYSYSHNLLIFENYDNDYFNLSIIKTISLWKYPKFKIMKDEKLAKVNYLRDLKLFEVKTTKGRCCYIKLENYDWLEKLVRKLKGYITYIERDLDDNFPAGDSSIPKLGRNEYSIEEQKGCDNFSSTHCYFDHRIKRKYFVFYPNKKAYLQVLIWNNDKLYGHCYRLTYKWTGRRMFYKEKRLY